MQVVARQRLFAALRPQKKQSLQLTAIRKRKHVPISSAKQPPGKVGGIREPWFGENHRTFSRHRSEIRDRCASRKAIFFFVDGQRPAFAGEEIHLLDVQRGAHTLAHHGDQLVDIVKRRQLLGEVRHGAAMSIALAIDEHLDHRLDPPFDGNQNAGDHQPGGERQEIALQCRSLLDDVREHQVHRGEGDHAEGEGDRIRQDLLDHHFDVPQLVLENGDRERERNQRERQNGDRGVDRLHRADNQIRNDVHQKERQEPQGHAQVDPLDLLLTDGGGGAVGVRQRHDGESEIDREVGQLPALNQIQRAIRRSDRNAVAENQNVDVPQRQERRRHIERGDQSLMPDDRPWEEEEEIQRQRRQKNGGEFFDQLQDPVTEVDVAGRGVDIDDE